MKVYLNQKIFKFDTIEDAIYEKILGGKGLAFGWQNRWVGERTTHGDQAPRVCRAEAGSRERRAHQRPDRLPLQHQVGDRDDRDVWQCKGKPVLDLLA